MALYQIDVKLAELTSLDLASKNTKQSIQEIAMETLNDCVGDSQRLDCAKTLYWEYPIVNSNVIANALAVSEHTMRKLVKDSSVFISCRECGGCEVEVKVESRTDMLNIRTGRCHRDIGVCDECLTERNMKKAADELQSYEKSKRAQIRLAQLKRMPYKEYLQSPEWDDLRWRTKRRVNWKCQLCNKDKATLNVHHKTYERIGEELPSDLIVLCKGCHAKFHDKESRNEKEHDTDS